MIHDDILPLKKIVYSERDNGDKHKNYSYRFLAYKVIKRVSSIPRIFIKTLYIIMNIFYKTINILNLFLTFKYVKHYHLGADA